MGPPAAVHVDVDGESIWALIRCDETSPVPAGANGAGGRFGLDCMYPDGHLKPLDTIYRFNRDGKAERSFGGGMFRLQELGARQRNLVKVPDIVREDVLQ